MAQVSAINRCWRLVRRPEGEFRDRDFAFDEQPVPQPSKDGEVLVRIVYLSLDPTNRIWARAKASYLPPVELGDVMRGFAIGVVEASMATRFKTGDIVSGIMGWADYALADADSIAPVVMHPDIPLSARFALYEHIGTPAYFGLTDVAKIKPGETLLVSAAAGAVGSLTVQMGKILGCTVVGLAGTDEKCRWLIEELGADAAINYRSPDLDGALARACPEGIDVYFDNVGGPILETVLDHLAMHGRVLVCGVISSYTNDSYTPGPGNLVNLIGKRAKIEGFLCLDYAANKPLWDKCHEDITAWHLAGKLKYRIDLVTGLENAPRAVNKLFNGTNTGKLMVQVSDEPS